MHENIWDGGGGKLRMVLFSLAKYLSVGCFISLSKKEDMTLLPQDRCPFKTIVDRAQGAVRRFNGLFFFISRDEGWRVWGMMCPLRLMSGARILPPAHAYRHASVQIKYSGPLELKHCMVKKLRIFGFWCVYPSRIV